MSVDIAGADRLRWKLRIHPFSSWSVGSSDVYRHESGRCRSPPFFFIYFYYYWIKFINRNWEWSYLWSKGIGLPSRSGLYLINLILWLSLSSTLVEKCCVEEKHLILRVCLYERTWFEANVGINWSSPDGEVLMYLLWMLKLSLPILH